MSESNVTVEQLREDAKHAIFPPGYRSQGGKAEAEWIDRLHRQFAVVRLLADHPLTLAALQAGAEERVWYWVTPVDNPDALGDYGGFTFQTEKEAEDFIEAEYAEWYRLQETGYYEADASPDLLQIETVLTVNERILIPPRENT